MTPVNIRGLVPFGCFPWYRGRVEIIRDDGQCIEIYADQVVIDLEGTPLAELTATQADWLTGELDLTPVILFLHIDGEYRIFNAMGDTDACVDVQHERVHTLDEIFDDVLHDDGTRMLVYDATVFLRPEDIEVLEGVQ